MEDSLNPYASPQVLNEEGIVLDPERTLTANFVIDAAWQRATLRDYTDRQENIVGLIRVGCLAFCGLVGLVLVWPHYVAGLLMGLFYGLFLAGMVDLLLWFTLRTFNPLLRRSPFPQGPCQVRIDHEQLVIAGEQWSRILPLRLLHKFVLPGGVYLRIVPGDDLLLIRRTADFGDDDFHSWDEALQQRFAAIANKR